jgi:hypothetical protein
MEETKTRTRLTIKVSKPKDNVHLEILNWLNSNKFKILSENSKDNLITYGSLFVPFDLAGPYIKLKVEKNSMLAVFLERVVRRVYVVVFEFKITDLGKESEIILQGYAAGTGLLAKKEFPLQNNPGSLGSLPRKKGFDLLNKFLEDFS